jgi:hypothetical protein
MADLHQVAPFVWNAKKERAALLVAEDELSDREIAKKVGVAKRTLEYWKENTDFQAHVGGYIGQIQAAMLKLSIAKKHKRVERYQELWEKCKELRDARAKAQEDRAWAAPMPGESTGLVATKTIGTGRNAIREAAFDAALVKAELDLAEQTAKELGQWVERSESEQTTTVVQIVGVEVEAI